MEHLPRILIIIPLYTNPKYWGSHVSTEYYTYIFPLGIGYIASMLKSQGYAYDTLNLNHVEGNPEITLGQFLDRQYDYVLTGGNSLIFDNLHKIVQMSKLKSPRAKVILGGPLVTTEPELMLDAIGFDYGVIGEGELTIIRLLDALTKGNDLHVVKGIIYRDAAGRAVNTGISDFIKNLDEIPYPELEDFGFSQWLDHVPSNFNQVTSYFDNPRPYPIMGSRGCPFSCTFCFHDQKFRNRSLDSIFAELEYVVPKYRINAIQLNDDCFAIQQGRVREFCERISALRSKVGWDLQWTVQLTVKNVDADILKTMKDAGCNCISYGFESYSPAILKSMKKPITPAEIDHAFRLTVEAGITVQANFILGDFAETKETYRTTIDYWFNNCNGQIGLWFIYLYPGSFIYKQSCARGIIKDKLDFIKNNLKVAINFTESMSDQEYEEMVAEVKRVTDIKLKDKRAIWNGTAQQPLLCPYCKKELSTANLYMPGLENTAVKYQHVCRFCSMQFQILSPKLYAQTCQ